MRFELNINKKSQVNLLINLIIIVIAAFLLFRFYSRFELISKGMSADFGCTMRVIASERAQLLGKDLLPAICPPDLYLLTPKEVMKNKLPNPILVKALKDLDVTLREFDVEDREQLLEKLGVIYQLILELRKCWYKFGSGRFNIFSDIPILTNKRFCSTCAINIPSGFEVNNITFYDIYSFISEYKDDDKYVNEVYEIMKDEINAFLDEYHLYCDESSIPKTIGSTEFSHNVFLNKAIYVMFIKQNYALVKRTLLFLYSPINFLINTFKDEIKEDFKDWLDSINHEKLLGKIKNFVSDASRGECKDKIDENFMDKIESTFEILNELEKLDETSFSLFAERYDKVVSEFQKALDSLPNEPSCNFIKEVLEKLFFGNNLEKTIFEIMVVGYYSKNDLYFLRRFAENIENNLKSVSEDLTSKDPRIVEKVDEIISMLNYVKNNLCKDNYYFKCEDISSLRSLATKKLFEDFDPSSNKLTYKDKSHFYVVFNNSASDEEKRFWFPIFLVESLLKIQYYKIMRGSENGKMLCDYLKELNEKKMKNNFEKYKYNAGLILGNEETISAVCDVFINP